MKQCRSCQLAFEQLDTQGLCEGCAAAQAQQPGQQRQPAQPSEADRLRAQLEESNRRFQAMQNPPQAQQSPDEAKRQMNQQMWADPAETANRIAHYHATQAAAQVMATDQETMTNLAESQALSSLDDDGRELAVKYKDEILGIMRTYQPQFHRNATVWKNVISKVIGDHYREILHEQREATQAASGQGQAPAVRVIRNDGPAAPSVRQAPASGQKKEPLTPEAMKIANKLDLGEERMRKAIVDFENQGDRDDPKVPSSWDGHISFDGKTGQLGRRLAAERRARQRQLDEVNA